MGILMAMGATSVILSLLTCLIGVAIGENSEREDISLLVLYAGLTFMLFAAVSIAGAGILFVWTEALK